MSDNEIHSAGAHHRVDDETGKPYWVLWGEGWKDSESMSPNEVIQFDPRSFPPGTRIAIIEPPMDDKIIRQFYECAAIGKLFYPLKGRVLAQVLAKKRVTT